MGLKDLFSTKSTTDKISKFFLDEGITVDKVNGVYKFELYLSEGGYSLYPYFRFNSEDGYLSITINIRRVEEPDYSSLNSFNLISKYFTAKLRDGAIILEYNTLAANDNVRDILQNALESIFSLQREIDKL